VQSTHFQQWLRVVPEDELELASVQIHVATPEDMVMSGWIVASRRWRAVLVDFSQELVAAFASMPGPVAERVKVQIFQSEGKKLMSERPVLGRVVDGSYIKKLFIC